METCGHRMDLITSLTSQVMNKALDGLSKRHKAIASNLANADTPNYRRKDVSFEDSLAQALKETKQQEQSNTRRQASNDTALPMLASRPGHFAIDQAFQSVNDVEPRMTESENIEFRNDGNAVDVESEMVQLARNTQKYLAISNLESRTMRSLKSVINGGGA